MRSATKEKQEIKALAGDLSGPAKKILFHAAAAHPDKTYPQEHWLRLMQILAAEQEILPVFTGSAQDRLMYESLSQASGLKCLNTAGMLSLRQSMALIAQTDLAICTDSGPAHLSAATGTPTIALFGPTDPVRWRPWGEKHIALFEPGLSCRPCHYKKSCQDRRQCLSELAPELIAEKAREMLKQKAGQNICSCTG